MTIDITDIFRELIPASFGGVPFWMRRGPVTTGRRVQKFLFPGRDDYVWEDLGALEGPMQISGFVIGDDYVEQAQAMLAAWRTPGPQTLRHPWLGEFVVILPAPGTITFDETRLRMATVDFTVELYDPTVPPPIDTLGALLAAIQGVQDQVNGLMMAVLAPVQLTVAAIGVVEAVCGQVAGVFGSVVGTAGFLDTAVSGALSGLSTVSDLPPNATYASAVAAVLAAPGQAIALTSATLLPAAVGPGDAAPATTPQDPLATAAMLLSATSQIVALPGSSPLTPVGELCLAAGALTLASAIDAASDIVFTSQQDAQLWLAQLVAGCGQVIALAVTLSPALPTTAGQIWNACQALQSNVSADINAQIGRLPLVQSFTLAATMPAWLVAQALSGDNPGQLFATYQDLVQRNNVVYPLAMGPGSIEALVV